MFDEPACDVFGAVVGLGMSSYECVGDEGARPAGDGAVILGWWGVDVDDGFV